MTARIVITDLDGTLLDRKTYGFDAAFQSLEEIRKRGSPLVLCTSKTAAETRHYQRLLHIAMPFIVEDGGGIYIPRGYFSRPTERWEDRGDHLLFPLAAERGDVLKGLTYLKRRVSGAIRGFSDMSVDEIAEDTGLSEDMAALAAQREFDEPFTLVGRGASLERQIQESAHEIGLRVTCGGRYYHLHGDYDKGRATSLLLRWFREDLGRITSIGLGDSPLDAPMLTLTDIPVLIPRPDGMIDPVLMELVPGGRIAPQPGPAGWNSEIMTILSGGVSSGDGIVRSDTV